MWLGMMCADFSNQKLEIWVRILPLSGMGVGSTWSNAEMRSHATMMRCSSLGL